MQETDVSARSIQASVVGSLSLKEGGKGHARIGPEDLFSIDLQNESQDSMRCWMLRSKVDWKKSEVWVSACHLRRAG